MLAILRSMALPLTMLLVPQAGASQSDSLATLATGQRVRVLARCELMFDQVEVCRADGPLRSYVGAFEGLDADGVHVLRPSNIEPLVLPTASIAGVYVVDGMNGHFWLGAGLGTLVGAVSGGVIGSAYSFCVDTCNDPPPSASGLAAVLGGLAGFLVGGILGSRIRTDRWRLVDGLGVALDVGF